MSKATNRTARGDRCELPLNDYMKTVKTARMLEIACIS